MQETRQLPKLEIEEDTLLDVGFHLHCFYNTFREQLIADYDQYVAEEGCEAWDFVSFCFRNFAVSFLENNYDNKDNN